MRNLSRTFVIALLTVHLPTMAHAQMRIGEEPARPSTDAWEAVKYGEISPSLYTGTVCVSIPVYTYDDPDFTLPVSLDYASNGCVANERAGILGHGWTLTAGGVMTREIRGIPDNVDETYIHHGFYSTYLLASRPAGGVLHMDHIQPRPGTAGFNYGRETVYNPGVVYIDLSDPNYEQYYDAEPDIYHFNIPGHSGAFHLAPGGRVILHDTDGNPAGPRIVIDIKTGATMPVNTPTGGGDYRSSDRFVGFTITTPDGYRYRFNGATDNDGRSPGNDGSNLDLTCGSWNSGFPQQITAWRLSSITAPNGRKVRFVYSRKRTERLARPSCYEAAETAPNGKGQVFLENSASGTSYSEVSSALLDSVVIDGGAAISFSYGTGSGYGETVMKSLDEGTRLEGISVRYKGRTIRSCSMSYTANGAYLASVTKSGEGTFGLNYAGTDYPVIGTNSVDHWGYHNGRTSAGTSSFLDVTVTDTSTFTETVKPGNVREPDASKAATGLLSRMSYPTGGWTRFDYEPHDYSRAVMRRGWNDFAPAVVDSVGVAGGLRLKRVTHFGSNGDTLASRRYEYALPDGSSSGILAYIPRYKVVYDAYGYAPCRWEEFDQTYMRPILGPIHGHTRSNNLTTYSSTHIEYASVTETGRDGGRTVYHFRTSDDVGCLDFMPWTEPEYDDYILRPYPSLGAAAAAVAPSVSLRSMRGRLKSKEKYASGTTLPVFTETNLWEDVPGVFDTVYCRLVHSCARTMVNTGWSRLSGTEMSVSGTDGAPVTGKVRHTYNTHGQKASESRLDSRGHWMTTRYTYVTDSASGPIEGMMADANVISRPTTESIWDGTEELSRKTFSFCLPSSSNQTLFRVSSVTETDMRTGISLTTSYSYDSLGHLVERTDPYGIKTVYVWGYGGMHLVAEIVNSGLDDVMDIPGLRNIHNAPLSGGLGDIEQTLRARVPGETEVTTWDYLPLVGMIKTTDPSGRSATYEYNGTGKLKSVRDDLGRLTDAYLYSTDNKR